MTTPRAGSQNARILAVQVTVLLGVLAGCAIVWTVVWGVMA